MNKGILLFKALGEETKHNILRALLNGELCVCDISKKIKKTQSNTSMHLSKLLDWKLVKSRRDGRMIFYLLNDPRIKAMFKLIDKKRIRKHSK